VTDINIETPAEQPKPEFGAATARHAAEFPNQRAATGRALYRRADSR